MMVTQNIKIKMSVLILIDTKKPLITNLIDLV